MSVTGLSKVRVFCVVFCRQLFVVLFCFFWPLYWQFLFCFFWPLYWQFFDFWILGFWLLHFYFKLFFEFVSQYLFSKHLWPPLIVLHFNCGKCISPGHRDLLQSIFELSVELPPHGFPPYLGAGLEHVRFLSLDALPPPQVTGHFDHELQLPYEDQPPFTEKVFCYWNINCNKNVDI